MIELRNLFYFYFSDRIGILYQNSDRIGFRSENFGSDRIRILDISQLSDWKLPIRPDPHLYPGPPFLYDPCPSNENKAVSLLRRPIESLRAFVERICRTKYHESNLLKTRTGVCGSNQDHLLDSASSDLHCQRIMIFFSKFLRPSLFLVAFWLTKSFSSK